MKKQRIGWIGLGNMGTSMALNLLKAGFEVTVYNRTESKAQPLVGKGATLATSIQELVACSDIIIAMVSDDAAVKAVFEGPDGILSCSGLSGKLAIDMSTVSPDTTKYLAGKASELGLAYLDAPVSGSVKPAQDGQLVILVGGEKAQYERAKPIFDCLGKMAIHLGANGAGNSAKLAINLMLAFYFEGMAEMVLFANKKGIATADMMAILNEGAMGCGISKIKTNNLVNGDFTAAFALKHLAKDLRLAKEQGLSTNVGLTIEENYRNASTSGFGDLDSAAIVEFLAKLER
jgi:3-hydroxyisobutyrate dehydrogenase